jgi:acyl dehydratase
MASSFQERLWSDTYAGKPLPVLAHPITPELVRWYTSITGDDHPWYTGASPFGGPVAPALVLQNPAYGPRLAHWYLANRYGNLHAKQAWDLYQPMPVGETVISRALVTERYRKRDRDFVVAEVWLEDSDGRPLAHNRSVQSFLVDAARTDVVVDRSKEKQAGRKFEPVEGPVLETLTGTRRVVSVEDCDRVVGESRNYHNDLTESQKLGFDEIVVQGAYVTSFVSSMMTERYGEGWFCGGRMALTFVNPLWAGEAITAGGYVREIVPEGPLHRANLDVWVTKDDGTRTIVGTASALME